MARVVVDANVIIALFDANDALHARAKNALASVGSDDLFIPSSAYAEILVGAFRVGPGRARELDDALAAIPIEIVPMGADIARAAARLRAADEALRLGDALVLGAAEVLGATTLTADARLGKRRGVRLL